MLFWRRPLPEVVSVPADTTVAPVYVLAPDSVSVPLPVLVSPPEAFAARLIVPTVAADVAPPPRRVTVKVSPEP